MCGGFFLSTGPFQWRGGFFPQQVCHHAQTHASELVLLISGPFHVHCYPLERCFCFLSLSSGIFQVDGRKLNILTSHTRNKQTNKITHYFVLWHSEQKQLEVLSYAIWTVPYYSNRLFSPIEICICAAVCTYHRIVLVFFRPDNNNSLLGWLGITKIKKIKHLSYLAFNALAVLLRAVLSGRWILYELCCLPPPSW